MTQEEYVTYLQQKLQKNKYVLSFMNKNKIDFSFVMKNSDVFEEWIQNLSKCENCKGLPFCSQKISGRIKNIYMDGNYLEECYVACKYKKNADKNIAHKQNYRRSDLVDSEYLIDLQKIDIATQSQDYVMAYALVGQSVSGNKGIYLYGQPGVGKTYLMIALANHYAKNGKEVSFAKVPAMIQECKDCIGSDYERVNHIIAQLKNCDVLFLDDIGAETITQWSRDSILLNVLNERMDKQLKTYFTSNYTLEELEEQYYLKGKDTNKVASLRLMERIRALSSNVLLKGESRRQ